MRIPGIILSFAVLALLALCAPAQAGTTPKDAPLADDGVTLIECAVRDPKENRSVFSKLDNGASNPLKSEKTDGYHYNLYVPKGYAANKDFRYPCLFISSPDGNANMGGFAARLKRDEWVVVMLQESRNGSPDWLRNFLAAHDDVVKRVQIAKGAKFCTGMSGGARCSSVYATMRPGVAGILCQAAGYAYQFVPAMDPYGKFPPSILVAGSFGDEDMNLSESQEILRSLKNSETQAYFFKGGHGWCPSESFDAALDWMEEELFVKTAKTKKGGNAPAAAPAAKTVGGKADKPEILGVDAFQWYYRKAKRLLEEATAKPARALALERLLAVVEKGKLGKDKAVADEVKAWQTEMATLRASPELKDFDKTARKAFRNAQQAEAAFLEIMKKGKAEYKKMNFSAAERDALDKAVKAYRAAVEKYPDSPLTPEAKRTLASLEVEFAQAAKTK